MQKTLNKKIVVTGGGSGGHISVASSLLSELEKRYTNVSDKILYIGGDLGMVGEKNGKSLEQKIYENGPYKFVALRSGKLQRIFALSSIKLALRSVFGVFDALKVLKEFKPDLIISTGGYVTVPVAISAFLLRIPYYLHEQTAAVGLTNKIASNIAKRIFVAYPTSLEYFPKSKTEVVGNPVRDEIFLINKEEPIYKTIENMRKNNLPIILIMGGSLGSHTINSAIAASLSTILDSYQIVLQTGENQVFKDYENIQTLISKLPEQKRSRIIIRKYINTNEIGTVLNMTDLFIGRSGANTVYELGVLKKPSILIPIPWVTHNEQQKNAQILETLGVSTILAERALSRDSILQAIESRLHQQNQIDTSKIKEIFKLDASEKIVDRISQIEGLD